jgi:hypothetical protein
MNVLWIPTWTPEWVSAIGTMLQGIFVAAATIGGFWTFSNWKREQIGRRKIEVAEEALALMYEAQDVFRFVRSRTITSPELDVNMNKEDFYNHKIYSLHYRMPMIRLEKRADVFAKIQSLKPKVMMFLGMEAIAAMDEMNRVRNQLEEAAWMLSNFSELRDIGGINNVTDAARGDIKAWINILLAPSNKSKDPIAISISEAVVRMERITMSYLK